MENVKSIVRFILVFTSIYHISCSSSHKMLSTEYRGAILCMRNWEYFKMPDSTKIEASVLKFYPKKPSHNDSAWIPNIIIGVDSYGDTIGLLDKSFTGKLKKNQLIIFEGGGWHKQDNYEQEALGIISNSRRNNDLACAIKWFYLGKISH